MSAVEIRIGPTGDEQEAGFMNATLQSHRKVAFSIAARVNVPEQVVDSPVAVASFLVGVLRDVVAMCHPPGVLTFEVEVGWEDDGGGE